MPRPAKDSPLAPTETQAVSAPGAYPGKVGTTAPSPNTTLVERGHGKMAEADPSRGTATSRTADLERNGAQYRVRHLYPAGGPDNTPHSAANQANTPVVQDTQRPTDDKNYAQGYNREVSQHFAQHRDGRPAPGVR